MVLIDEGGVGKKGEDDTTEQELQEAFKETINQIEVAIFPNPASDKLFYTQPIDTRATIEIYNYNGKLLRTENSNEPRRELDISALTAGSYVVRVLIDGRYKEWVVVKQ